jgi:3-oxoacyl-[acyl-carrier protein] reductase
VDEIMLLKDKVVVVTGSNRGIGKSILELFHAEGASIFACARTQTENFEADLKKIASQGQGFIKPIYFDFSEPDQIKNAIQKIIADSKVIDVLVNNAGIASGSLFQMTPVSKVKEIFEINFFAQLQFSQSIARLMTRAKSGSIINMASVSGLLGDSGTLSYGSSKAALIYATKTMARELGEFNVRVNAIAPSVTKTDMFNQMESGARDKMIMSTALRRPAEVIEVANVALFLASDLSSYVTGQTLRVDGGLSG